MRGDGLPPRRQPAAAAASAGSVASWCWPYSHRPRSPLPGLCTPSPRRNAQHGQPNLSTVKPPVKPSYIYLLHVNVYLLAVTRANVNAGAVLVRTPQRPASPGLARSGSVMALRCCVFGAGPAAAFEHTHTHKKTSKQASKQANKQSNRKVFLHRLVAVFRHYFEELEEESVRDNFVTVYELLDEVGRANAFRGEAASSEF